MTNNPRYSVELLAVLSIALTHGLVDRKEVAKWADNIILQNEKPDRFIIELSLCQQKSVYETVMFINKFIGHNKPKISGRVILGFLYRAYITDQIKLAKVISTINWIVWENEFTDEEKTLMCRIDENYDCAIESICGSIKTVKEKVLRFLEIYKNFRIDNFEDWKKIDTTLHSKVSQLYDLERQEKAIIETQSQKSNMKWWMFYKKLRVTCM